MFEDILKEPEESDADNHVNWFITATDDEIIFAWSDKEGVVIIPPENVDLIKI